MPGKEILESSGDEGCDIFRYGEYGVYGLLEGYWCGMEIGDKVSAITLRKRRRKWVCECQRSKTEKSRESVVVFLRR
jgi:hypothetical protein